MQALSPEEYTARIQQRVPIAGHLGIRAISFENGQATLIMPFAPHLARPVDVVSGPALMGLADISLGAALLMDIGLHMTAFTADLNIRFLRKAVGCDIRAVSRVLKLGKTLSTSEVHLTEAETGILVAHATGSFSVQELTKQTKA